MLAILVLVEFVGCCLVTSAIWWLRYLYGARLSRDWHATAARYVIPLLTPILVVLFVIRPPAPAQQPHSHPQDVGLAVVLGIALAALFVWLVVEVGRYSTRDRGLSHSSRPYYGIPSRGRRAKTRRGKNGTR